MYGLRIPPHYTMKHIHYYQHCDNLFHGIRLEESVDIQFTIEGASFPLRVKNADECEMLC